jgi:AraC family transcriptional activator of pobA
MSKSIQAPSGQKHLFDIRLVNQENPWPWCDTTQRLSNYEMIWIEHGAVSLDLNLNRFEPDGNTIWLLAPGQIRRLKFCPSSKSVYFRFPTELFYQLSSEIRFPTITRDFHHLSRPMEIQLTDNVINDLKVIFSKMFREFSDNDDTTNDVLYGWLKIFMLYLARNVKIQTSTPLSRDTELARRFMELVSKNFTTKKMVSDYADNLLVTPNYLNQIVKRVSGFPASHHIQQYLILEAKRQATQSCRSMKEIAYDLGFDDLAHFSKFFKSKSGINFSSFKKSSVHRLI